MFILHTSIILKVRVNPFLIKLLSEVNYWRMCILPLLKFDKSVTYFLSFYLFSWKNYFILIAFNWTALGSIFRNFLYQFVGYFIMAMIQLSLKSLIFNFVYLQFVRSFSFWEILGHLKARLLRENLYISNLVFLRSEEQIVLKEFFFFLHFLLRLLEFNRQSGTEKLNIFI